jgi:hypothetical protein
MQGLVSSPHHISSASERPALLDIIEHLLALGGPSQVFIPVLRDQNVILDADPAHVPVLVEFLLVDVLGVSGVSEEVALNVFATEVAEPPPSQYLDSL